MNCETCHIEHSEITGDAWDGMGCEKMKCPIYRQRVYGCPECCGEATWPAANLITDEWAIFFKCRTCGKHIQNSEPRWPFIMGDYATRKDFRDLGWLVPREKTDGRKHEN